MVKSMTGYGKGSLSINSREYQAEIKTVNHKYIDININSDFSAPFINEYPIINPLNNMPIILFSSPVDPLNMPFKQSIINGNVNTMNGIIVLCDDLNMNLRYSL